MTEIKRIGIWPRIVVRLSPYLLFIHHSFEPGVRVENRNSVKRSRKSRQTGWLTRSDKVCRSAGQKGNMRKRNEKGVARFRFTWMFTSELNKPLNVDLSSGSVALFFSDLFFLVRSRIQLSSAVSISLTIVIDLKSCTTCTIGDKFVKLANPSEYRRGIDTSKSLPQRLICYALRNFEVHAPLAQWTKRFTSGPHSRYRFRSARWKNVHGALYTQRTTHAFQRNKKLMISAVNGSPSSWIPMAFLIVQSIILMLRVVHGILTY